MRTVAQVQADIRKNHTLQEYVTKERSRLVIELAHAMDYERRQQSATGVMIRKEGVVFLCVAVNSDPYR